MQLTQSDIITQLPGFIGWKDSNLIYLGCNANLANILKLSHTDDIIGLKDEDLIDCTERTLAFHRKNDLLVLAGKTVQFIHVSSSPYNGDVFNVVKKPLLNNKKEITGVIYHCTAISPPTKMTKLLQTDKQFCPATFIPDHYHDGKENKYKLSMRELQCLFYFLRSKKTREIGHILNLSQRTVETYFENIKNKFGVQTKTELLIQAIYSGYMNIIPINV